MTDTTRLIAELEELEKKATPGPLTMGTPDKDGDVCIRDESGQVVIMTTTAYAALIVATRNALPELIASHERYRQEVVRLLGRLSDKTNDIDAAIARAEKAEAELASERKAHDDTRKYWNKLSMGVAQDADEEIHALKARAEKAEAGICERTVFCDVKDAMADLLERAEKAEARSKELREWGRKKHERIKELKQYLREMHIRAVDAEKRAEKAEKEHLVASNKVEQWRERAEAAESALAKTTMCCPYCDCSSGMRGGERCIHCDGTGRMSVIPWLKADRDDAAKRAERAEAAMKFLARAKCMKGVVSEHLDDPEDWIKGAYEWADHEAAKRVEQQG